MKRLALLILILFSVNVSFAQVKEQLSEKEKVRREKNIQAGNPFKRFGYKPKIATLSKGKYLEFHDLDTIMRIGSFVFNTRQKKITGYVNLDTVHSEATFNPQLISRWLSPDPLCEEFPSWSPYTYTANNPIRFIDPDGRYFIVKDKKQQQKIITALATAFNGAADAFSFDKKGRLSINREKLGDLNKDQQFLYESFNDDVVTNKRDNLIVSISNEGKTKVEYKRNKRRGVDGIVNLNINQSDFMDKMKDTKDGTINGDPNFVPSDSDKMATAIYHEVGHFREDFVSGNRKDSRHTKEKKAVGYENIYRKIRGFNIRQGNLHGQDENGNYIYQGQTEPTGYKTH